MNIDSVKTGFVIDHIGAGNGMNFILFFILMTSTAPLP